MKPLSKPEIDRIAQTTITNLLRRYGRRDLNKILLAIALTPEAKR